MERSVETHHEASSKQLVVDVALPRHDNGYLKREKAKLKVTIDLCDMNVA